MLDSEAHVVARVLLAIVPLHVIITTIFEIHMYYVSQKRCRHVVWRRARFIHDSAENFATLPEHSGTFHRTSGPELKINIIHRGHVY